jgi:hypothetical protein
MARNTTAVVIQRRLRVNAHEAGCRSTMKPAEPGTTKLALISDLGWPPPHSPTGRPIGHADGPPHPVPVSWARLLSTLMVVILPVS